MKYKIVCLDDEPEILEIYRGLLEPTGYEIETFLDPVKAKEYADQNSSKIVFIF